MLAATVLVGKITVMSVIACSAEALQVEHHSLESRSGMPAQLSHFALSNFPISRSTLRQSWAGCVSHAYQGSVHGQHGTILRKDIGASNIGHGRRYWLTQEYQLCQGTDRLPELQDFSWIRRYWLCVRRYWLGQVGLHVKDHKV